MALTPSDIQHIAAFVRKVTKAPNSESIISEILHVLSKVTTVKRLRVVHVNAPGRWTEWQSTPRTMKVLPHQSWPPPQDNVPTVFFDPDAQHEGFISAAGGEKIGQVLTIVSPQVWGALLLRSAADRVQKLSYAETEVAGATLRARDEERRHIARELHDDIGQSLASLNLGLKWAEDHLRQGGDAETVLQELAGARRDVGLMLDKIRDLSRTLYPPILDTLGLTAAIKELVHQAVRFSRITVEFNTDGEPRPLEREKEIALYRCCQEAINNVIRHSQASKLIVGVSFTHREVRVAVEDNGKGFNPRTLYDPDSRMMTTGFWTIRQRVAHIGASFRVSTAKGRGTVVEMILPHTSRETHVTRKNKSTHRR
jgi:signal transduction histidine kinase